MSEKDKNIKKAHILPGLNSKYEKISDILTMLQFFKLKYFKYGKITKLVEMNISYQWYISKRVKMMEIIKKEQYVNSKYDNMLKI